MKVKLEIARYIDYLKIAKIYKEEFSKPPYNEKWTLRKAFKRINDYSKFCEIWKIKYGRKTVGFSVINTKMWFPYEVCFGEEIAVSKKYQRRGIGEQAIKILLDIYKEKGYETFMGIADKRAKAYNLYKKIGLKESKHNILVEKALNARKNKKTSKPKK